MFSGPVDVKNSEEAEIEAIIHLIRLIQNKEVKATKLCICSDSTMAIASIRNGLPVYVPIHGPIQSITHLVDKAFHLEFTPRDLNRNADSLAKMGLNRPTMISYWA